MTIHKQISKNGWILGNYDVERGYKFRGYWEVGVEGSACKRLGEWGLVSQVWRKHLWKPRGPGRRAVCRRCGETSKKEPRP